MTSKTLFYTGKGDEGDTARLGGEARLSKDSALIDTIGILDEATCAIGMARAQVQDPLLKESLPEVQRRLYRLMSHLSATPEQRERYAGLHDEDVVWLESLIEALEANIPQLKEFVLPGDSPAGAACHMARSVVRRAERRLVAFAGVETGVKAPNLAFINRLSSLMFVAALREDTCAKQRLTTTRAESNS
jgi:cob(I)alamin adenosyltransferase